MTTSAAADAATGRAGPSARIAVSDSIAARAGAWGVLFGTVVTIVGISWDIQWHGEVGPDTFFTVPHLLLYSGSAISGFVSLAMVLLATAAQRAGRAVPRAGGTPIRVFGGTLTAPLGYMVAGAGAAAFLLYGLLDLEWHSIYGFDAVLNTPSHVALFLSISVTMIGSIIVFAAQLDESWARYGVVSAIAILIAFAPFPAFALVTLALPVDPIVVGTVLFATLLLILGAVLLARSGAALIIAVALGAMQAILWWFSPWAAETYAEVIGLPLRDNLSSSPPEFPSLTPMFLIVAAAVVDGLFRLARGRGYRAGRVVPIAGAAAGFLIAVSLPIQRILTYPAAHISLSDIVTLAILGIPLGALAGFLGGRFATMLRTLAPTGKDPR